MATVKKASTKLFDVLKANIGKGDQEKALEQANRDVKKAKRAFSNEIGQADEAVDSAKDNYQAVLNNAGASGSDILRADRAVTMAEANLAGLMEIFNARF